MMITLIPEPARLADTQQRMVHRRFATGDAQILLQIGVHQALRGGLRADLAAQIDDFRRGKGERRVKPLRDDTVALLKTHSQRVGFHHARHDGARQQRRVNRAVQLDEMRHTPGVGLAGEFFSHPDTRLRRHQRQRGGGLLHRGKSYIRHINLGSRCGGRNRQAAAPDRAH